MASLSIARLARGSVAHVHRGCRCIGGFERKKEKRRRKEKKEERRRETYITSRNIQGGEHPAANPAPRYERGKFTSVLRSRYVIEFRLFFIVSRPTFASTRNSCASR